MTDSKIESLLFIANRPLPVKRLAELCDATKDEVEAALVNLADSYAKDGRGLRLVRSGNEVQMTTAPESATLVQDFLKDETTGELTKPSLETLTIIAYRGPITKPELEQVRGVNCSLILRNLLMRGLVEVEGDAGDITARYRVTIDFLRFLGVAGVEELPDYERLRSHENIVKAMDKVGGEGETSAENEGEAPADAADGEGPADGDEVPADDSPSGDAVDGEVEEK
jgi:segregation and condensation protein B